MPSLFKLKILHFLLSPHFLFRFESKFEVLSFILLQHDHHFLDSGIFISVGTFSGLVFFSFLLFYNTLFDILRHAMYLSFAPNLPTSSEFSCDNNTSSYIFPFKKHVFSHIKWRIIRAERPKSVRFCLYILFYSILCHLNINQWEEPRSPSVRWGSFAAVDTYIIHTSYILQKCLLSVEDWLIWYIHVYLH